VIQDDISNRQLPISGRHADIRDFCMTELTMALLLKEDKASKMLPQGTELADCLCGVTDFGALVSLYFLCFYRQTESQTATVNGRICCCLICIAYKLHPAKAFENNFINEKAQVHIISSIYYCRKKTTKLIVNHCHGK